MRYFYLFIYLSIQHTPLHDRILEGSLILPTSNFFFPFKQRHERKIHIFSFKHLNQEYTFKKRHPSTNEHSIRATEIELFALQSLIKFNKARRFRDLYTDIYIQYISSFSAQLYWEWIKKEYLSGGEDYLILLA